jgi:hypothetical protein
MRAVGIGSEAAGEGAQTPYDPALTPLQDGARA